MLPPWIRLISLQEFEDYCSLVDPRWALEEKMRVRGVMLCPVICDRATASANPFCGPVFVLN
jgi:hypothetical protein